MKKIVCIFLLVILCSSLEAQWQQNIHFGNSFGYTSLSQSIAASNNLVHVVWHDYRFSTWEIYYKRSIDNGLNWGADTRLTFNAGQSDNPSIYANGLNVYIVWHDNTNGYFEIFYKRSSDGGINWGPDTRLTNSNYSSDAFNSFHPSISVIGSFIHVVWHELRDGNREIYYKRSTDDGTSWETDTRLTNNSAESDFATISGSGSTVNVSWKDNRDGNNEIYFKRSSDNGVSWSSDFRISNDPGNSQFPCVTTNGSNAHIVWDDNRFGNNVILYKKSSDGGLNWGSDTLLTSNNMSSIRPSIISSGTNLHLAWYGYNFLNYIFYKHSSNSGITWSTSSNLTNTATNHPGPSITTSGQGVHLAWTDNVSIYYKGNPILNSSYTSLTSPNGGENFNSGTIANITWITNNSGNIKLELTTDNGNSWSIITSSYPADSGRYSWTVPSISSNQCKIRIIDVNDPMIGDTSDNFFSISPANLITGLIAYYPFETNANDYSGNSHHGSFQNSINVTSGVIGNGVQLNGNNFGSGGYISLPPSLLDELRNLNNFSISIWAKEDFMYSNHGEAFISFGDEGERLDTHGCAGIAHYINFADNTQNIDFFSSANTNLPRIRYPVSNLNLSTFNHFTMTYENGNLKAFVNGILVDSTFEILNIYGSNAAIGKHWWSYGSQWSTRLQGIIDDVRIYNRTLSYNEVIQLYRQGAYLTITNPNGGENLLNGQTINIAWNSLSVQSVKIELTSNNGGTWSTLSASFPADSGRYSWTVPNIFSTQCKIKISDTNDPSLFDISDSSFIISPVTLNTGLIAYYPFNGNPNDESGNNNHGTNYGATLTSDINGVNNGAYLFDGVDDFIGIPDIDFTTLNSITVNSFIYASGYNETVFLCHAGTGDLEFLTNNNLIRFWIKLSNGESYECSAPFTINQWIQVTGTWEKGNKMRLWLNGQFISELNVPKYGFVGDPFHSSSIGAFSKFQYPSQARPFSGKIDEVRFYNRALSEVEIQNLYGQSVDFSLTMPNGGESWQSGTSKEITWNPGTANLLRIEFTSNNGGTWSTLSASYPADSGRFAWTVPNINSTQCKIRISQVGGSLSDVSDYPFSIVNNPSSLSGQIKNSTNNNVIIGAGITLTSQFNQTLQVNTNNSGDYSFTNIPSGNYSMRISKTGFRTRIENFALSTGAGIKNFSLTPDNVNEVVLSEGKLKIFADNIYEIEENYFKLTGNVNINGILFFSGEVKVNKRAGYFRPVIESSSRMTAKNIMGMDKTFMNIEAPYKLIVDGNDLIPQTFAYLLDMPIQIQGFPLKLSGITVNNEGTEVQVSTLAKFPYPLDVLAGWSVKKNTTEDEFDALKRFMNSYSGKKIYNRLSGEDFELSLSIPDKLRLGYFDLEELDLSWNSGTQVLIGGIKIKVPGSLGDVTDNININGNQIANQSAIVDFVDKNGMLIYRTDMDKLHNVLPKDAIEALFALRFELELRAGKIERVSASLSDVEIPFGIPGFVITEINADVENISERNSNILIRLTCDIEAGLVEIPFLGPPLTIDNAGGEMVPSSYIKLKGGLKIFDRPISEGSAEFNYKDAFVKVKGKVDILDIIRGDLNSTIKYKYFSGEITGELKTPQSFLHPRLKFLNLENRVFSDARIAVENKVITAQTQINFPWRIPIAVRLTFGNPIIVEAGTNLEDLIRVFNNSSDAAQTVSFIVPPNSPGILITADNGINLFDFVMQDPFGRVYDSTNSIYKSYNGILQTVMYVDKPRAGEWDFITTQSGAINVYPMTVNQSPSQIISTPSSRSSINSMISLKVNDYSDTVDVSVYYDNDNKDFNGSLIKKFRMINNVNLNFEWNNHDVPDGEYFIYTIVNDGKNASFSQYAPGSILVDNNEFEEKPLGLSIQQFNDTVRLSWVTNTNERIGFTKIYCMSMKDNSLKYYTALDTNSARLTDLEFGKKYKIWASFVDTSGKYGPSSDTLEWIHRKTLGNNPPCFIAGEDSTWTFIEGELSSYYLNAIDADGNALSYSIRSKPIGVSISSNKMQWIPTGNDIGLHYFTLIVSDGLSNDTLRKLVIVRSEKESRISIAFSSPNLYDTDNKFLTVKNIRSKDDELSVNLRNLSSNQNSTLSSRRINESEFISEVALATTLTDHFSVAHGDTIEAKYNFNGNVYSTYSVFDTSSQASDNVAPAPVNDLVTFSLATNKVTLNWTAPGDNGMQGEALKYDIRYSYLPITDESSYFTAHKINSYPYPSPAGTTDSMTFDLKDLVDYLQHDTVYFSIKAEDAHQNRSSLGNSAGHHYIYSAIQLNAAVAEIHKVHLSWTGVEGPLSQILGEEVDAAVFKHYRLFRKTDTTESLLVKDSIIQNTYTDNLYYNADDTYYYALQAVYDIGGSDTIYSEPIVMNRFSDVRISCQINGSSNVNDSIQIFITGLDSVYFHSYFASTGPAGIVTFNNVYNSNYSIRMVKQGVGEILDTIVINDTLSQYNYSFATLMKVRVGIEGMYSILTGKLNSKDTLKIYLRSSTAPYSVADSTLAVLDSTNMYADCAFENAPNGQYYIVVKHRNSIETWSKSGGEQFIKNSIMEYDFTDASSKAFGENLTRVGSVWCLFSGDVNQDGTVDASDLSSVDNDAANFISGYVTTDLTGDGFVDGTDFAIADNNAASFVGVVRP